MGEVVSIAHRYRDRKNKEHEPILNEKVQELKDWFHELYPEAQLNVQFVFSRSMGEELMLKREVIYKKRNVKHTVTSTTEIHRRVWSSPYLMEKFLKDFVEEQKATLLDVMKYEVAS